MTRRHFVITTLVLTLSLAASGPNAVKADQAPQGKELQVARPDLVCEIHPRVHESPNAMYNQSLNQATAGTAIPNGGNISLAGRSPRYVNFYHKVKNQGTRKTGSPSVFNLVVSVNGKVLKTWSFTFPADMQPNWDIDYNLWITLPLPLPPDLTYVPTKPGAFVTYNVEAKGVADAEGTITELSERNNTCEVHFTASVPPPKPLPGELEKQPIPGPPPVDKPKLKQAPEPGVGR